MALQSIDGVHRRSPFINASRILAPASPTAIERHGGGALYIPLQVSRTALGRIDITKRLLLRRDHRLHALLHFLRRDVSLCVATHQRCPNGSSSWPERSP